MVTDGGNNKVISVGEDNETPQSLIPTTDQVLPQKAKKNKKLDPDQLVISGPKNFRNPIHVDFNSDTGFVGLPAGWEILLKSGGITKDEILANSAEVLQVLQFHENNFKPASPAKPKDTTPIIENASAGSQQPSEFKKEVPEPDSDDSPKVRKEKRKKSQGDLGMHFYKRFFFCLILQKMIHPNYFHCQIHLHMKKKY